MSDDLHANDPRFVEYYRQESASDRAVDRAMGIMAAVLRVRNSQGLRVDSLAVADIGCNAGTQSRCWLERGHLVRGLDISSDLVALARQRNKEFGATAGFEVGSATKLPWRDASFDVCLLPELLEHVEDWQACLTEAVRVLKSGGTLYLSTTNVLCPVQQEYTLPLYSWYPRCAKRRIVRLSLTTRREWVNFASYPAIHWFSPYRLGAFLRLHAVSTRDRFDTIDLEGRSMAARWCIRAVRALPPLRFLAHSATPGTTLIGTKGP